MIEEKIDALAASIESLAAQLQNETLKEILARDTIDLLTLTFRTHVLRHHCVSHRRFQYSTARSATPHSGRGDLV